MELLRARSYDWRGRSSDADAVAAAAHERRLRRSGSLGWRLLYQFTPQVGGRTRGMRKPLLSITLDMNHALPSSVVGPL
jgi:hypothetical protein